MLTIVSWEINPGRCVNGRSLSGRGMHTGRSGLLHGGLRTSTCGGSPVIMTDRLTNTRPGLEVSGENDGTRGSYRCRGEYPYRVGLDGKHRSHGTARIFVAHTRFLSQFELRLGDHGIGLARSVPSGFSESQIHLTTLALRYIAARHRVDSAASVAADGVTETIGITIAA